MNAPELLQWVTLAIAALGAFTGLYLAVANRRLRLAAAGKDEASAAKEISEAAGTLIEPLNKRIHVLEDHVEQVTGRNLELEMRLDEQLKELAALRKLSDAQEAEIAQLENTVEQLQAQNAHQAEQLERRKQEIGRLTDELAAAVKDAGIMKAGIAVLIGQLEKAGLKAEYRPGSA